ncbi:MAG: hypothetical protein GKR94_19525 [Gammaproteobacteria bacterium]|nr:hypothetical protein [Gammaproteobacteria bacterium]
MDFSFPPEVEALRAEVREFLAANLTEELIEATHDGTIHAPELHAAMAERGWISGPAPEEPGGAGRTALESVVLNEKMQLKRVFTIDIETCSAGGGTMRVIACIEGPAVINKILDHTPCRRKPEPTSPGRYPRAGRQRKRSYSHPGSDALLLSGESALVPSTAEQKFAAHCWPKETVGIQNARSITH